MTTQTQLATQARKIHAKADRARERVLAEIEALGLQTHLAELESQGFTTIKGVLDTQTIDAARACILDRVESQIGKRIDLMTATEADFKGQTYLPYLLYDDEVFARILLAPKPLAMITYLLGESCLLSSLGCHFKGPGADGVLPLHSDNGNGMPAPFPAYSQVANINYALTPYSKEAGALALVPGSHHLGRPPNAHEMMLDGEAENPSAVPMELDPGDAVVWHGNTWHGSYPRKIPGVRVNLAVYCARQYVQTQEQHKGAIPESFLQKYQANERMMRLLGAAQPYGWGREGPDYSLMRKNPQGLFD